MRLLFLHLSDIHIKNDNKQDFGIDKIVEAINSLGEADSCIIVISGDVTDSGAVNEFKTAGYIIGTLVNKLKAEKFKGSYIYVVVVPGNHDLICIDKDRSYDKIINSYKNKTQDALVNQDIQLLGNFYDFAKFNKCYTDDRIISNVSVYLKKHNLSICFTLINTAIFSLSGGSNKDMGIHYLSKDDLKRIKPDCNSCLNIVVMHHSIEWYNNEVKEELKKMINSNYDIIFEGHEHDGFGENRKSNNESSIVCIQGNSLSGDKRHKKGFATLLYDIESKHATAHSFIWNKDFYKPTVILNEKLPDKRKNFEMNKNEFKINEDFQSFLTYDDNEKCISSYFVFPSLDYSVIDDEDELEIEVLDDVDKLIKLVLNNDRIVISGESRYGKTTIAKVVYESFLHHNCNIMPLYLQSENLSNKQLRNIDNVIERTFELQYKKDNDSYDKYLQLNREQRLLIIDDVSKLDKSMLDKVLDLMDSEFSKVILLSEGKINIDIKDSVEEALISKKICKISIKPFLYDKRKELIAKIYCNLNGNHDKNKLKKDIYNINNRINSQIRSFRLDPEFISHFVEQFGGKDKYSTNHNNNVFNMVYETSVKDKLIQNAGEYNPKGIFNVLAEIAYEMHFKKLTWISLSDVDEIVNGYNKRYRKKIKTIALLTVGTNARLLVENENMYKFKDKNLKAYFVAQALNKKYNDDGEDVNEQLLYVLNNVCFSINSDIMLFMAMITNNTKILKLILKNAADYFNGKEEFNFDLKNIPFIFYTDFNVKSSIPNEDEKKDKEKALVKYEEEVKYSEVIELIDEYGYDESDVVLFENRIYKAVKYIEIISNILPSFINDIVVEQQDEIVEAIYSYPNRLVYEWLKDTSDDFDKVAEELYEKLNEMRKEKNVSIIHLETIRKFVGQMGILIILNLYQIVSNLSSTKDTLEALNDFDLKNNSAYKLINLMIIEKSGDFKEYSKKSTDLYDKTDIKLIKSMVKFSVRNYVLNNDIVLSGDGQAFLDKFFGAKDTNNNDKVTIKKNISKRRIKEL